MIAPPTPRRPHDRGPATVPRKELEEPELPDELELDDFEDELELDDELLELEEELLEDEPELDDDVLLELEDVPLELELELEDEAPTEDEELEGCSSGFVTLVAHPPSMPTPARATPPERIFRSSRRSTRRVASSLVDRVGDGLSAISSTSGRLTWQAPCQTWRSRPFTTATALRLRSTSRRRG